MNKQTMLVSSMLLAALISLGCDGPFTVEYALESDRAVWAVPLPASWDSYYDHENDARWIPAWPRRDWQRDGIEKELARYQVTLIAGLNQAPTHPVAVFAPGREWRFICPADPAVEPVPHPEGEQACLQSVSEPESGSVFTGGAWHSTARATVRLEPHGLAQKASPAVDCRGDELADARCRTDVATEQPLESCHVKMVRIWQNDRLAWHNVPDVDVVPGSGRTQLSWPFLPDAELQGVDHPAREHDPPTTELPPLTFALFHCTNHGPDPVRFVAAPVVLGDVR